MAMPGRSFQPDRLRPTNEAIKTEERALEIAPEIEAFQSQLEKFREAKANESGR